jgi:hypothetical protein
MPRYVILEHDHPHLHWDLMLESGDVLRTWRLPAPPGPGQPVAAEPSFDHRLVYLEHEGRVSGDRGQVKRWDSGTFEWETNEPDAIAVRLSGRRLSGVARLERGASGGWSFGLAGEPLSSPPASGPAG